MDRILGITRAREEFSNIIEQVQYQGDSYIISRHGKPAAAVVPIEVYENWKRQREAFFDAIRRIQEANKDADPDQVMQDVLQAQQAVRSFT
ncbi:MAG: type II toxin-antitoxin system Phd/YefM family antitoxin [Anaerolineae bacterium]|nr:type II toxin-antitoxin system Phd/YefM family antitoxin [Anaerolineae bacterium]